MAIMNVNPTRMALKSLKGRLKTAERGYKLLKDKTDEMVRRFSEIVKTNKALRDEVEEKVIKVLLQFSSARSLMSKQDIEQAFSMPSVSFEVECSEKNIMNMEVPSLELTKNDSGDKFSYSFIGVTSEVDFAVASISKVMEKLVKLAELEKTMMMLAGEIEKNKRRVNALEYVMIPDLQETIKYITMKLEENERGSLTRLMKVKSMIADRES